MLRLSIINGPNLNLLEKRTPSLYGGMSLKELMAYTNHQLENNNIRLNWFQSNREGELVEEIHDAIEKNIDGIVINPGGFAHTSVAIHDALEMFPGPVVEVHLSHTIVREDFRKRKVTARAAGSILEGHGKNSYFLAVLSLIMSSGEEWDGISDNRS